MISEENEEILTEEEQIALKNIFNEGVIKSPMDIDMKLSKEAIDEAKEFTKDALSREGYRPFKSEDKKLIKDLLVQKNFIKKIVTAMGTGALAGALYGYKLNKLNSNKYEKDIDEILDKNNNFNKICKKSKKAEKHYENRKKAIAAGEIVLSAGIATAINKFMKVAKYSVFTYQGCTILSIYSNKSEKYETGKSVCYAIVVRELVNDSRLIMKKINIKSK